MTSFYFAFLKLFKALMRAWKDDEFHALSFLLTTLLISGTIFYHHEEGWKVLDAFYFCVMTMTTIGYGDLTPTTDTAKIFTIIYAFMSIGVFVALAAKLAQALLNPKLAKKAGKQDS
ncbi:MAG: potassium channel family protein [Arenicellales bacterium]|jgi:voltage-gated potassium channel